MYRFYKTSRKIKNCNKIFITASTPKLHKYCILFCNTTILTRQKNQFVINHIIETISKIKYIINQNDYEQLDIYRYTKTFLNKITILPPSNLEVTKKLEQLYVSYKITML